jgi:PEGA domain
MDSQGLKISIDHTKRQERLSRNMKTTSLFVLIAALSVYLTGCASIFTGTTQTVQVNSIPSGANVSVNGLDRGQTPLPVVLKKGSSGETVTLALSGYQQKTFQPQTVFNPVSILNLWGILGWGIDAATGAMWKYDPTFYNVQLQKVSKN